MQSCRERIATGLRSDESGYDNLVLAGDWTDSGDLTPGCIEAAVLSGLQAATALLGRGGRYRIRVSIYPERRRPARCPQPAAPLAVLLMGFSNQAVAAIAGAEHPLHARQDIGRAVRRLVEGLRYGA
jgi:hypothetical protein